MINLRSLAVTASLALPVNLCFAEEAITLKEMVSSEESYQLARETAKRLPGPSASLVIFEIDQARRDHLYDQGRDDEAGSLFFATEAERGVRNFAGALSAFTGGKARRELVEEGMNKVGKTVSEKLFAPSITTSTVTTEIEQTQSLPFLAIESSLHAGLSSQTTGLASPLGSVRPTRSPDPELERALAMELDSPFTTSVETPDTKSSGAFTGAEGLNVAGLLNVFAYDSGRLEDGDRVRLTVTDSRGVQLNRDILLTFGGTTSTVSARRGIVKVKITALNVGSAPPNTGGLRVSGEVSGNRSGNFNLSQGQSGTLVVRVLGN